MKKKVLLFLLAFFSFIQLFCISGRIGYAEEKTVYLGGMPAGFDIETRGALVVGLSDVITKDGIISPAKNAGLDRGDILLYINGKEINCADDVERLLLLTSGEIEITFSRCNIKDNVKLTPATDLSGIKKIGVLIKDSINGIGTVTFIDDDNIATLGHPVLNEDGKPLELLRGNIYPCMVTGYIKGERGKAGELRGAILTNNKIATITKNTEYGVFGKLTKNFDRSKLKKIGIGNGKPGKESIYTTIEGDTPQEYSISIIKADSILSDTKNFVIKITDERLLNSTGGIIQGMSGSPIVQDGKLVGAVTHVFIIDPTRGFGISINSMLNQSNYI
ncbi:MAG: SpoIVB peptidase [Clostridia bacterium]|nr:SpoIVB peptidase [Clostridia bacterium]